MSDSRVLNVVMRPQWLAAVVLLIAAIWLLIEAQVFGRSSGMFPRFIGTIFVLLAAAEVLVQTGHSLRENTAVSRMDPGRFLRELLAVGWLVGLVVLVFLVGFLVTVPVFIFVFLFWNARLSLVKSGAIALGSLVFVYLIFMILLEYRLYPGLLFGA